MTTQPAAALLVGLAVVLAAALAPAGLGGQTVPVWSWGFWSAIFVAGLVTFRASGLTLSEAAERVVWLLITVLVLALPACLGAPPGHRMVVLAALVARSLAAVTAGASLAARLGPAGFMRALRRLGAPDRLVDITEAMLASLSVITRHVHQMLRAREARRPSRGAWSAVIARPVETIGGFGRLVAALLLRSLERAEALELARRARGGGDL